ncbi:glycosyltransferase family 39 protein [Scytonema sp. NUACC21]
MLNRKSLHYLYLIGVIFLGAILRVWHLDLKPLWMDEVITAIFSLGKNYNDFPLDVVFPLERLQEMFSFQRGGSYFQIANNVATQSTHPPLFFCGMYSWLSWVSPLGEEWVAKLRLPSALFGVGCIVAIYYVNRIAFFPFAGLVAAALMAVSPFAVYLSQEARHYTLPMLLITLGLLGLVQIQRDIEKRPRVRFVVWAGWAIVNTIGLYVHYFCALAFIAQIVTLLFLLYCRRGNILNQRKIWLAVILYSSSVAISFLPWLAIVFYHFGRSETDWIEPPQHIAPLFQTLIGWILMVIALPVENQPLPIVLISGLLMLAFSLWISWHIFKGLKQLLSTPSTHLPTLVLLIFTACVLLEFFAIVYFLGKNITTVPRYNFVYYPSWCALLAASLSQKEKYEQKTRKKHFYVFLSSPLICLFVGLICSVFVVSNLVFQKPFEPEQVAKNMNQDPSTSLMVVMAYRDYQDVALGLSFALALEPLRSDTQSITGNGDKDSPSLSVVPLSSEGTRSSTSVSIPPFSNFAFFKQSPDFTSVWQKLSQLPAPTVPQLDLWVIGPGRKRKDYPPKLAFSSQMICAIDLQQHYRIGIPYQLYRCGYR